MHFLFKVHNKPGREGKVSEGGREAGFASHTNLSEVGGGVGGGCDWRVSPRLEGHSPQLEHP